MHTSDIQKCKLCGTPVRIVRRADGSADHYEGLEKDEANALAPECSPALRDWLRLKRKGKRTVALVGSAYTTGGWAPYGEPGVEVWSSNETHGKAWMRLDGITAWFQLHPRWSFTKAHRWDHFGWLKQEHPFPIYMQQRFEDVPSSRPYPLREVQRSLLGSMFRGEAAVEKVFTSTFAYQMALALHLGNIDRIEVYGIELALEAEYVYQREAMAFWTGMANGLGVEVWIPEACGLLLAPLYAWEEIRKGDTGEIIVEPEMNHAA